MSVNSKMTAIANATRALDGSTAALTLDGIASKLGVEKSNVDAALAAIAEKGVSVPTGSTSDALAALIASIEAGGGGVKMSTGTYTPAADEHLGTPFTAFEHNSGFIPNVFVMFPTKKPKAQYDYAGCMAVVDVVKQINLVGRGVAIGAERGTSSLYTDGWSTNTISTGSNANFEEEAWNESQVALPKGDYSEPGYLRAGVSYIWYAFSFEGAIIV